MQLTNFSKSPGSPFPETAGGPLQFVKPLETLRAISSETLSSIDLPIAIDTDLSLAAVSSIVRVDALRLHPRSKRTQLSADLTKLTPSVEAGSFIQHA